MSLKERQYLFSNLASKIESFRSRTRRCQNSNFDRIGLEVGNLKREYTPIPELGFFNDPFCLLSNLLHRNDKVDVEENHTDQVRTVSSPVLKRLFQKIRYRSNQPSLVPYANDDIG